MRIAKGLVSAFVISLQKYDILICLMHSFKILASHCSYAVWFEHGLIGFFSHGGAHIVYYNLVDLLYSGNS